MKNSTAIMLGALMFLVLPFSGLVPHVAQASEHCENITINIAWSPVRGEVGEEFSYKIDINGGEADNVEVRGELPEGLELDSDPWVISGTPENGGSYKVILFGENECDTAETSLRMDITNEEGEVAASSKTNGDTNVSVTSTLVRNDGSYVHLNQIPYTGVGDTLRFSLIITALLLWSGALAFLVLGPGERAELRTFFSSLFGVRRQTGRETLIDTSIAQANSPAHEADAGEDHIKNNKEHSEADVALLQKLRVLAYEEKVLVTEQALQMLERTARERGEDGETLLNSIVEEAKGYYPRVDGLLKIDSQRLIELINQSSEQLSYQTA